MSWPLLIIIGVVASVIAHIFVDKFIVAILASSVAAATIPLVMDLINTGRIDKFWIIAFIMLVAVYSMLSFVIGIGMRGWQESRSGTSLADDDDDD